MLKLLFFLVPMLDLAAVNSISVSGNPSLLSITTATAGQPPNSVQNSATTYSVTTTAAGVKVLGKISSAMPTGTTLSVQLAAPTGGTSVGSVAMTTTSKNLVTGIPTGVSQSGLQITYTLSATSQATPRSNATRTLTLTIQ